MSSLADINFDPKKALESVSLKIKSDPNLNGSLVKKQSGMGNTMGMLGGIGSSIGSMIPGPKPANSADAAALNIRGGVESALMSSGNPIAMGVGAAVMAIDKTGGFTSASKGLGSGTDALNFATSLLVPGAGYFTPKTNSYNFSKDTMENAAAFGGAVDSANTAKGNANAKILFGRGKANTMILHLVTTDNQISDMVDTNKINMSAGNAANKAANAMMVNSGGYSQFGTARGRNGLKFDMDFVHRVLLKKITSTPGVRPEVEAFLQGGAVSTGDKTKKTKTPEITSVEDAGAQLKLPAFLKKNEDGSYESNYYSDDDLAEDWAWYASKDSKDFRKNYVMVDGTNGNKIKYITKNSYMDYLHKQLSDLIGLGDDSAFDVDEQVDPSKMKPTGKFNENGEQEYIYNKPDGSQDIYYFKEGGEFNVIPDGALHKNKHNLEQVSEDFKDVTHKGIPVITKDEKGDVVQHAEVEVNEIILRLDVTKKLEELKEKGTDDAAIEAGKLLVKEILHNTKDMTGLIDTVE